MKRLLFCSVLACALTFSFLSEAKDANSKEQCTPKANTPQDQLSTLGSLSKIAQASPSPEPDPAPSPSPKPKTKKTSKDVTFTRVLDPKGWLDEESKVIWLDKIGFATPKDAPDFCKKLGGELPKKQDYIIAENHGFREVISQSAEGFWASSKTTNGNEIFKYDGTFGFYLDQDKKSDVRCIKRP